MLELLDREFKTAMTNMLKALMGKADYKFIHMSREIKTLNQNAVIEIIFVDRLDTAKGRISELEISQKK